MDFEGAAFSPGSIVNRSVVFWSASLFSCTNKTSNASLSFNSCSFVAMSLLICVAEASTEENKTLKAINKIKTRKWSSSLTEAAMDDEIVLD